MGPPNQQKPYDVITFSDMCVDLILNGPDMTPVFGQVEKLIRDYTLEMGGSCNIFACQCAKLGLHTTVLGRVGSDSFGQLIVQRLQQAGVDTRRVIVDPTRKTGIGVALCPPDDRAILTYLGTINAVYPEDIGDDIFASTRHIHHGSYYLHTHLLPSIPDIFARAHQLGVTTSLDTNWDPAESWSASLDQALPHTDILMLNEQEALRIFKSLIKNTPQAQPWSNNENASTQDEQEMLSAARYFLELGVQCVAIKAGKKGASLYTQDQVLRGNVQPVTGGDSIGAGDSFDGGFLAGWLAGDSLEKCLQMGIECGRSVAGKIGGLEGQPTRTSFE